MQIAKSFTPKTPKDWRRWLEMNHAREQEVWLVYFKPSGGKTNIDYETSVEEALCFGWIDSIIRHIDEEKYARRFNPRRVDSQWSESNKRRVAKVIADGRMTEAGMSKVTFEARKVDLNKPKAKRPPVEMTERIRQALQSDPKVWEAFQRIAPSYQRSYTGWLAAAKKPETFGRRLKMLVEEVLAGRPSRLH